MEIQKYINYINLNSPKFTWCNILDHPEEQHFKKMRELVGNSKFNRVLDIGCGEGHLTALFRDCAKGIIAFDKNETKIQTAKKLYPEIEFINIDMETHCLHGKCDLVILSEVIYYFSKEHEIRIMDEIYKTLEADGYMIVSRHGDETTKELDKYKDSFELINSEWVEFEGNTKKWNIALFKKKHNRRDTVEILEAIDKFKSATNFSFEVYGAFHWVLTRDRDEIIYAIKALSEIQENLKSGGARFVLLWALKAENDDEMWRTFQESIHSTHPGATTPDFRLNYVKSWIKPNEKILDVGIHNGVHTNEIAKTNEIIGIDLPQVIENFKDKYNFKYMACDVTKDMGMFKDNEFDVIIAGEIIEHLTKPKEFIKQLYRILKSEGKLIVTCPFEKLGWEEPSHCNLVNEDWIRNVFDGQFEIAEVIEQSKKENDCLILLALKK